MKRYLVHLSLKEEFNAKSEVYAKDEEEAKHKVWTLINENDTSSDDDTIFDWDYSTCSVEIMGAGPNTYDNKKEIFND